MIWQIPDIYQVSAFAKSIGCDWIGYVRVDPDASCDLDRCHSNVDRYILSHGGKRVIGYYMLESEWGYQAILHSIWESSDGILIDITPFADKRNLNVFAKLTDSNSIIKNRNIYSRSLAKYQMQETDNMYYVYALIDPRNDTPFYIGKGKGRRANTHLWETPETRNEHKENKIAAIRTAGMEPRIEYLAEDIIDERMAYDMEEDLILKYGRKGYEPNGILTNICLSGRPPNHKGKSYEQIYGSSDRAMIERKKRADTQKARGGYGPRFHSTETKEKIRQKSSGSNNGMYGRRQSNETRQKIRENRKPVTGADHPISRHWQLIAPDGTVYEQIGDLIGFCKKLGISFSTMHAAYLYNRIPTRGSAKGWRIKVLDK